ncbi:MAG TPA: CRISPR-associated helicase Cas3' [Thermoclostridium sp.]|nr:CRISPR-associated helicase Cas3' [Thermoclostridium sp.]
MALICNHHLPLFENALWAKKSDKDTVFQWLPLKQHLIDVAEVIKLLWEHWLSTLQRQQIINSLSQPNEERAKNLAGFLAATHDIGKATPVFQSRPSFHQSLDLDGALLEKLERVGFLGITGYYNRLMNPAKTHHAIAGQTLLESFGVARDISSIVGAHHGNPVAKKEDISPQLHAYTNNYFQNQDKENAVHHKWRESQKTIFDWALKTNDFEAVTDLPSINQPGQVLLSGLLIMADWIASNESYFPLIPIDKPFVENMEQRIAAGWIKWYQTAPRIEAEHTDIVLDYKKRFDFKPNDLQEKLFEIIEKTIRPGIIIVEAPMGVGKTEAALIGVEQLSMKTKASGMFFGLPTQATSDGIFGRIKEWLEKLDDEKKSLQLVHGKAALNDSYTSLPRSNVYDESDSKSIVVNQWFSGRKTAVLDDFIVGTIDQFLMTALKQKHLALRHLGFSKKVIVIDEVHAYDAYMNQYLCQALRWMGAYGVPVLILSATLPAKTRIKLIKDYTRGSGKKWRDMEQPDGWETTQAYPLLTYTDGMAVKQFSDIKVANHSVVDVLRLNEEELIETLDELMEDGGIAGIIVNTVKRSQEIAEICKSHFGEDLVELLHSNFIATDRIEKEKKLLETIGKGVKRPYKKIIVGTQVMEQSLDINFDLLVTDLAPMDLLIQRIGRLHRHPLKHRPERLEKPQVFVMGTSSICDFEPGSSSIYGDYLLIRTQLLLPDKIYLPQDISPLVQAVYRDDDSFIKPDLKEEYDLAKGHHEGQMNYKKQKANGYLLDKPSFRDDKSLVGWLKSELKTDVEERAIAQVRDIQETIEVIALKEHKDGYTFFDQQCDLSCSIHDPSLQKNISRHTLRLPLRLSLPYNIDQTILELEEFNRRFLPSWQESAWLKGMLGIIFDENSEFLINGFRLKYCQKQGLSYQKSTEGEGGN